MNVFVLSGSDNIVVSGTDATANDTVQVVIASGDAGASSVNDSFSPVPANQAVSQNFNVNNATYNVSVYWDNGASASFFTGIVVPSSGGGNFAAASLEAHAISSSNAPSGPAHKYKKFLPNETIKKPTPIPAAKKAPANPTHIHL